MRSETFRLITSLFLAPLALASVWLVILLLTGGAVIAVTAAFYVYLVTFILYVVIGLPVHFVLKSIRRTRLPSYLLAAVLLGAVIGILLMFSEGAGDDLDVTVMVAGGLMLCVVFTTGVGWAIARPDRAGKIDTALFE
jgi:hypothetical protein